MMDRVGRSVRLAVRTVVRGVRKANDEQVRMWECLLLSSTAAPAANAGHLADDRATRPGARWNQSRAQDASAGEGHDAAGLGLWTKRPWGGQ